MAWLHGMPGDGMVPRSAWLPAAEAGTYYSISQSPSRRRGRSISRITVYRSLHAGDRTGVLITIYSNLLPIAEHEVHITDYGITHSGRVPVLNLGCTKFSR